MPCRRPCPECPWRVDVAPGQFPPERYAALEDTRGRRDDPHGGTDAPLGSPWFACHKSREGEEFHCAGWLASQGQSHIGVRLAVAVGELDPEALSPGEDWPELYPDYDALLEVHG